MRELTSRDEADALLAGERAVVFKYSTRCPVSTFAYMEMREFELRRPDVAVHAVDVLAHRELSRLLADRTGVVHHSPQVLVLRGGRVAWTASHGGVTADALAEALGDEGAGAGTR